MEFIDNVFMGWLSLLVIPVAFWSMNNAAIFYSIICWIGGAVAGIWAQSDPLTSVLCSGVTALILGAGCYYYRSSDEDDIAFNLFMVSGLWLITCLVCVAWWFAYLRMEALNPIFAGIMILSIILILIGRLRELRGNQGRDGVHLAFRRSTNRWKVWNKILQRKEAEA